MGLLADLSQVFILVLCLIGAGLLSRLIWPEVPFGFHFCFAPLAIIGLLFCLEHYFPLGQLPWLWVPWSLLSLILIKKAGPDLFQEPVLWYFSLGFGICFLWRFSFPDIYSTSEMLPDLNHLVSYSAGGKLPAEDTWMKGTTDDTYYIFQYYAAGLIHRFMGSGPGMTYHLGYCALVGIGIAAAGEGVRSACKAFGAGLLASLTLVLGGVGSSYLLPLMTPHFHVSAVHGMRFIGSFAVPATPEYKTAFGVWITDFLGKSAVDAPMEYYSYIVMLGDFHPSLSSLAFFGLAILAIGMAETAVKGSLTDRFCVTGAIASAVFVTVSNTWMMPLQVMLVSCWLVYRWWSGRQDRWIHILGSGLGCFILIFPFFMHFAYQTRSYPIHIEWVQVRPPLLNWILMMSPALLIWLLTLWEARKPLFAWFATIVGIGALLGTYFLYVHDIYGGTEAIFNTTLKWWPWVYALVMMLGLIAVWPSRARRRAVIGILLSTILFNGYIFQQTWREQKLHSGQMDGYAWFLEDHNHRNIYLELLGLPKGVVLESVDPKSYDVGCSLSLFAGHYSVGGWTDHEMLWRGGRPDIEQLAKNRDKFYKGTLENPESWLRCVVPGGVDYVIWLNRDNDRGLDIWPKINEQIKGSYDWRPTFEYDKGHWGIWVKRS